MGSNDDIFAWDEIRTDISHFLDARFSRVVDIE